MKTPGCSFVFLCAFLLTTRLPAQEPVRIRIQAVSLEQEGLAHVHWFDGNAYQPLAVPSSYLPLAVSYTGPNPMPLFLQEAGPEGEVLFRPSGAVQLPAEGGAAILLLRRRGGELAGQAVPLETGRFPDGSYMVFNLSPELLFVSIHEEVTRIHGGGVAVVRPGSETPAPIPVLFRRDDQTDLMDIVTTTWFYNPRARHLVFFYRQEGREHIRSLLLPFREE